jgi:hypothetical protein
MWFLISENPGIVSLNGFIGILYIGIHFRDDAL